jgi:hypothetical protein
MEQNIQMELLQGSLFSLLHPEPLYPKHLPLNEYPLLVEIRAHDKPKSPVLLGIIDREVIGYSLCKITN